MKNKDLISFENTQQYCTKCNNQFHSVEYYIADYYSHRTSSSFNGYKTTEKYENQYKNIEHKEGGICVNCIRKPYKRKFIILVIIAVWLFLLGGLSLFMLIPAIALVIYIIKNKDLKTFSHKRNKLTSEEFSNALSEKFTIIANDMNKNYQKIYLSTLWYENLLKRQQ
jgi:hypothetical protein